MRLFPIPLSFLAAFLLADPVMAQGSGYRALYRQAEAFYNAADPDRNTDSMALALYGKVIAELAANASADTILADCYLKSGILGLSANTPQKALPFFLQAIALGRRDPSISPATRFQSLLYAGSCYYERFDLDSSLYYYRLAQDILEHHSGLDGGERLYNKMGVLYYEFGDYRRSIPFFTKALALVGSAGGHDRSLFVNYRNNIATAWLKLGQYEKAVDIYRQLLPLGNYRRELSYNIGSALLDAGKPAEAIGWIRSSGLRTRHVQSLG